MANFVITDANTSYNKGDAAIVLGFVKTLKQFFPKSEISLLSMTPEEDKKFYSKYGIKICGQLFNYNARKIPKIFLIPEYLLKMFLYLLWTKFSSIPLSKHDKTILMAYKNADAVISCGGGTLGGNIYVSITKSLFPMYLAKKLGSKVIVSAQSIEPFKSIILKNLTRFVLKRIDMITLREPDSFELVRSLDIKKPTYLTADTAFLVDSEQIENAKSMLAEANVPTTNRLKIGITVRKGKFSKKLHQRYMDSITTAIEEIIKETQAIVVFFPNMIFAPREDDRVISFQIKNSMDKSLSDNVIVLTKDYSPEQLKSMMSFMDIFIGTRIHSNILATSMNVPAISISYEKKHYGIMGMVGLRDYILDINTMNSNDLLSLIHKIMQNRDTLSQTIKEKLPNVKNEATRNIYLLKKLLENDI